MSEATLLLIKPDAVAARRCGAVLARLEEAGFVITGLTMRQLDRGSAERFYSIHLEKEFFAGLVEFMTSGPLVAVRIEGPGVRRRLRDFVGATDPARAAPGTIRADFGTTVRRNAVHASNPDENVAKELAFFFS
ncbi:nucleoside-diphosphate kinase [candidate division WOR-3 bacterium]|nr:nucleoside-diphosphate kinase [candidate division WOR-3 bacterium]